MPKIFIRVRRCEQIKSIMTRLEDARQLVTGFIIPKFEPSTADEYIDAILDIKTLVNVDRRIGPVIPGRYAYLLT